MSTATLPRVDFRADFPGLEGNWHYLDTAATAQKPQAVIDAVVQALGADYATVHRGVYARSAAMTLAFEEARRKVAAFLGGQENEIVFTRGATEAINLVAHTWGQVNLGPGDRILLSVLEHHSNIVPWQLLRERTGVAIDVCPLTEDGRIDLDAAQAMLTPAHKLVALAHVSNVLGSVLDCRRAVALARGVGAKVLLDGCQAVPRLPVDVAALGCDFYVFSAHKLYGPTGIGALWARAELLEAMPPWHGGGAMIDRVTFERTTFAPPPARFEAGTPAIVEAIGLGAAIDYVQAIGLPAIHAHEAALVASARAQLRALNAVTLFGPEDSAGIVSFALEGVHPHDLGTILDEANGDFERVAIRAGHHCAQPLMDHLGVAATARASFGLYNDESDIAALLREIEKDQEDIRVNDEPRLTPHFSVEEVDGVPPPPRARVEDAVPPPETLAERLVRKRDYLDGFLAAKPAEIPAGEPGGAVHDEVIAALKEIFDPEIPVNIYDLGLIYGVDVTDDGGVVVTMTLTTPHCPVAESMPGEVEMRVCAVPGVRDCEVNLVWDPPWDMAKMSDEAKLELGML